MSSFAEDVEKCIELAKRKDGALVEEKKERRKERKEGRKGEGKEKEGRRRGEKKREREEELFASTRE